MKSTALAVRTTTSQPKMGGESFSLGTRIAHLPGKGGEFFQLSPLSLAVVGSPSIGEWAEAGERLSRIGGAVQWWIGDWLNYGEPAYGEAHSQYIDLTGYKYQTLANFAWVALQIEFSRRRENSWQDEDGREHRISWGHHEAVSALEPPEQDRMLALAVEKHWGVHGLRRAVKELKPSDYPPWLCYTDVWNIPDCDERFGIDYPGRIPGQIIQNLLYYYTEPGALIVDPMAGGGITLDVCKAMDRRCIAFDLAPHAERRDILGADALEPWPVTEPVDLVFVDPPYWSQQEDAYGGLARAATHEDFLVDLLAVMHRGREHLKPGGLFAILLAPMAIKTEYQDSPIELVAGATRMGWKLVRRFSVPVSSQQVGPQVVADCKAKKIPVALLRDLLLFRAA